MRRFSLFALCYVVAGSAGYLALVLASSRSSASIASWLVDSLGFLYGTLLYIAGLSALYMSCRIVRRVRDPAAVATALPIAFLPSFIGVVGLVHGYISIFRMVAASGTYPKPNDMLDAQSTVLVCLLTGLVLTFPSFVLLAVAMVVKQTRFKKDLGERDAP